MFRMLFPILLLLPMAGCGKADADPYDSADPLNCLTIFSATSGVLHRQADQRAVGDLNARILYIAQQHGGPAWLKEVAPQMMRIGAAMEASQDRTATLKLFDECKAGQESDATYRAAAPGLRSMMTEPNPN